MPGGTAGGRTTWIGSIVVNCHDFDRMLAFWSAALRYAPRRPPSGGWVVLEDPAHRGPNLSLNRVSEAFPTGFRLHLDLYSTEPLRDVERLVGLGATVSYGPEKGHDFVTLEDPEGNVFDVVDVNWPDERTDWWFGRKA